MAQIFPPKVNKFPVYLILTLSVTMFAAVGFVWYYWSPKYTDVGYRPDQPIEFSHKLHTGDLGMDCRYCHSQIEYTNVANIPPTQTCMNCHQLIGLENEKLIPVRESWATGDPIDWIRVHNLPDYAYFDHGAHLNAGVGCVSCHGNVRQMAKIMQQEPLSMGWCLECHRDPAPNLRPISEITNMEWQSPTNHIELSRKQISDNSLDPPTDCSGCHR